jgi:hypothetical protein
MSRTCLLYFRDTKEQHERRLDRHIACLDAPWLDLPFFVRALSISKVQVS